MCLHTIINFCHSPYFNCPILSSWIPLKAPKRLSEINFFSFHSFYDKCDNEHLWYIARTILHSNITLYTTRTRLCISNCCWCCYTLCLRKKCLLLFFCPKHRGMSRVESSQQNNHHNNNKSLIFHDIYLCAVSLCPRTCFCLLLSLIIITELFHPVTTILLWDFLL